MGTESDSEAVQISNTEADDDLDTAGLLSDTDTVRDSEHNCNGDSDTYGDADHRRDSQGNKRTDYKVGRMRFVDLFAGIGGFSLGLERAGMRCVGQVEINTWCQKVLKKHWPDVRRLGDIKDVAGTEFGSVDLVCGGFPCEPFSVAGKRLGAEDDRFLWPEMLRVIQAIRPAWIIGENVVGIKNMVLDDVLSDLESRGYQSITLDIPNCSLGSTTVERHIWIIAASSGFRCKRRETLQDTHNRIKGEFPRADQRDYYRWNLPESRVCRMGEGFSGRLDKNRLRSLGRAVSPRVPEILGRAIMAIHPALGAPVNTEL